MSREHLVRITTVEGNTFTFPDDENIPPLWHVEMTIRKVGHNGAAESYKLSETNIFVELETLQKAGLAPHVARDAPKAEPEETPADLMVRLLELLGYYPNE